MRERFNHFDADSVRAAQEEPTLVVGQFLYRGRLLSIEEWMVHAERLDAIHLRAGKGEPVSPREMLTVYRSYLRAVFPRRRFRFWAPDPVKELLAMPWGVVLEATQGFFVLQARAMAPRPSEKSMNGTDSPNSTLAQESAPASL